MDLYVYGILVEKDAGLSEVDLMNIIASDARLSVGVVLDDVQASGYSNVLEVKPVIDKSSYPNSIMKSNVFAYDIYIPSLRKLDYSWVENTFISSGHSGGYNVIATKEMRLIHLHK